MSQHTQHNANDESFTAIKLSQRHCSGFSQSSF